jgi:hypothetical protein
MNSPTRYDARFYAIGVPAVCIEQVQFFQGFNMATHQMKPRFFPLDLSGCGQIVVYLSWREAKEVLASLIKTDPSLNLEVILL